MCSRSASSTIHGGAGRLLDQLLVAALDRAVALAEVNDVAVGVGEHLDLDVAGVGQVALEVDRRVAEELLALAGRALERVRQLAGVARHAEALAAAAAGGLDRDRIADAGGDDLARGGHRLHRLGRAGDDRHAGGGHQLAGARLRSHRRDRRGRRPDEDDSLLLAARRRTQRSRRGSRSRDGSPRRPTRAPQRGCVRCSGSSPTEGRRRAGRPRRPGRRASASRSSSE